MKPLDTVKVATAHRPAPRGQVPPRATNRAAAAAGRPRYTSSVEEAKAAAEAAAAATAAKKAIAAAAADAIAEAAAADGVPTSSAEPTTAPADDIQAPPASPRPASESAPTAEEVVVGESDVGAAVASESLPRREEVAAAMPPAPDAAKGFGPTEGAEQTVDPFVRSQELPLTPTPATTAPVKEAALTAEVPPPSPRPGAAGDSGGTSGVLDPEGLPEAVTPVPPEGDKGGEGSPGAVATGAGAGDPFASRSNIPRTPTDQVVPPQQPSLPLFQESVGVGGGGGGGRDPEAMDLEGARLQIRELNQELACKRDSLAKQAEERKR